ncbi:MAG: diguanylate cyclase [Sphingomonadaceae bacterium]
MASISEQASEARRIATLHALQLLESGPEERFDRLTRLARRLFNVPFAKVTLVDSDQVHTLSCCGGPQAPVSRDIAFCSQTILDDEVLVVPDALADPRYRDSPLVLGEPFVRFYAGCPLTVMDGSRLGALCLIDHVPRKFTLEDQQLLRDLAALVERELAAVQLATQCDLTGLANRRGFEMLGQQALEVCKRLGKPAALLYFDLNRFKAINDRYGHGEGDHALRVFVEVLRRILRSSDLTARLGGDEFVAMLIDSDDEQTAAVIERLRATLAARNAIDQRGYDIHFSVGQVALDGRLHATISAMMNDADAEMYRNKVAQRNAVAH